MPAKQLRLKQLVVCRCKINWHFRFRSLCANPSRNGWQHLDKLSVSPNVAIWPVAAIVPSAFCRRQAPQARLLCDPRPTRPVIPPLPFSPSPRFNRPGPSIPVASRANCRYCTSCLHSSSTRFSLFACLFTINTRTNPRHPSCQEVFAASSRRLEASAGAMIDIRSLCALVR